MIIYCDVNNGLFGIAKATQNSLWWSLVKDCDIKGRETNEKHEQRREKT